MDDGHGTADGRRGLRVLLARPRGFCAGVTRAIEAVERALAAYGPGVHVRHEIVHNPRVVEGLRRRGAVFVEELDAVPDDAVTVLSAHGVARAVEDEARRRALPVVDATCPLVAKVHNEAERYAARGFEVVLIGHAGHPEVVGTLGRVPRDRVRLVTTVEDAARLPVADATRLAYVTQTTLSVDDTRAVIEALRARFPSIVGPDVRDICYATQNRQRAVRALAPRVDVLLVVGAANSSNSNRLRDIGAECGVPSHLLDDAAGLDPGWLVGARVVGVTAGASAPEESVRDVLERLRRLFGRLTVETLEGIEEAVRFKPAALPPPAATG